MIANRSVSASACTFDPRRSYNLIRRLALLAFGLAAASTSPLAAQDQSPAESAPPPPTVFTDGATEPRIDLKNSPEARDILDIARLTSEAAQAFDRGDADRGRGLVRQALQKLAALERAELQRGNGSGRSQLATQRGRLQLEYLGDTNAAKEAFLDALEGDNRNEEAQRRLLEILTREDEAKRANRRGNP